MKPTRFFYILTLSILDIVVPLSYLDCEKAEIESYYITVLLLFCLHSYNLLIKCIKCQKGD